ncbi:CoA ester lyase [Pseudonocardia sp.]|uniref:HpcH/HpaI aldolase/citrate lyase family protein n=1 Tax=Pseudonocardia sp. TaxID=60912 RepID=UPI00262D0C8D|nr:CoA ester lyase [Pseudonocardia sp.]
MLVRTLLFVPGGRADMIAKVTRSSPDVVAVDLEDAVAAADKDSARRTAAEAVDALDAGDTVVLVRVNPPGSPWFDDDVAAVAASRAAGVVLPKLERESDLTAVRATLPAGAVVVAGLETALGVADCRTLLGSGVDAAYFGAEDYIADLGGRRTADGHEVLYARSRVALAARLAGVPAIDQAVVAVRDPDRFRLDAGHGRDLGYQGKICLHPTQVEIAREVFTPSEAEIAHARAVVAAGAAGVGVVDGEMVDDVHLRMAAALLARAGVPS